jgi:hypothetical protein
MQGTNPFTCESSPCVIVEGPSWGDAEFYGRGLLAAAAAEKMKPKAERVEVLDATVPGLYFTIYPSGRKSFAMKFRGKADMACCGNPLSRSLLGAKRTCPFALQMSANDPKRALMLQNHLSGCSLSVCSFATIRCPILTVRGDDEAARVHHASQLRGGDLAARCPRAAA